MILRENNKGYEGLEKLYKSDKENTFKNLIEKIKKLPNRDKKR